MLLPQRRVGDHHGGHGIALVFGLRIGFDQVLAAIGGGHVRAHAQVIQADVALVPGQLVAQVDHALARVLGVDAVGITADDFVEIVQALLRAIEVARRDVGAGQAREQADVAVEVDDRLQVVRVVDVRMARVSADEAVDAGGRILGLAELVLHIGQFQLGLLAVRAERKARDQAGVVPVGVAVIAVTHVLEGVGVEGLDGQGFSLFFLAILAKPAADGLAAGQCEYEHEDEGETDKTGWTHHQRASAWAGGTIVRDNNA